MPTTLTLALAADDKHEPAPTVGGRLHHRANAEEMRARRPPAQTCFQREVGHLAVRAGAPSPKTSEWC